VRADFSKESGVRGAESRSSFEDLRTNGGGAEMVGEFPFMLSLSKHLAFFSRGKGEKIP
jgi:hypothetical protein